MSAHAAPTAADSPAHAAHDDHHHGLSHVMPLRQLFTIFFILIGLTVLTVALAEMDLGQWEIIITMTIATIKATLVAVYFMHLRYDRPINAVFFLFSFFFVALFVGFLVVDSHEYQPDMEPIDPIEAPAADGTGAVTPSSAPAPAID